VNHNENIPQHKMLQRYSCTCSHAVLLVLLLSVLLLQPSSASRANTAAVQRLPSKDMPALMKKGYVYLDVRTPEEFAQMRVPGSVNIPYMYNSASGRTPNAEFIKQVEAKYPSSKQLLIIGCATGKRSAVAAAALAAAGKYSNMVDNAGGLYGWVDAGLPVVN
jgi:rhodanese-related sulfurtransferase